jgi:hypothetical protein
MSGTFQGVNSLQFTPDNKYCYAYSGSLSVDTTEQTMLEFTTNSEYIIAKFNFTALERTGDQLFGNLYLNNVKLATSWSGLSTNNGEPSYPLEIIIPPFTTLKATGDNITAAGREFAVTMIGTVHGSIEQLDLEVNP